MHYGLLLLSLMTALPGPTLEAQCDACALLTPAEIEAVQGTRVTQLKPSPPGRGAVAVSQCYYQGSAADQSVVVTVFRDGSAGGQKARDLWRERFAPEGEPDERGEEEEASAPARRVQGLGDKAFWTGSRGVGALYVLRKDALVRISLGGPDDEATKIRKATSLARNALARL